MRLLLVVLAATLAGCTLEPEEPAPRDATGHAAAASAPPRFTGFASAPRIEAGLAVEDRWVRPGDLVNATASSPSASAFEWYVASRNPIRVGPPLLRATLEERTVASFPLDAPGRQPFALAGSDARFAVTVAREAPPLRVLVQVVGEGADARFVPEDALTGVGGSVLVERPAGSVVQVRAEDRMLPVGEGPRVSFVMPEGLELGDHDLVLVARAGGDAWGEAAARLIYDNRKPDARVAWSAGGQQAPLLAEGPQRFPWSSAYDVRWVEARLELRESAGAAPSLRLSLEDAEGRELASGGDRVEAPDLPRGEYAFVVTRTAAAVVSYRLDVELERVLVPPGSFFNS